MMRRFGALLVVLTFTLALAAQGWTLEDCVEVNYDHPDCEQYWTTTTAPTTTTQPEVTTTTVEVTTTTGQTTTTQEVTTTTEGNGTTTTQPTTTETQPPATTTTIQECPPGTEHNPPFCTPILVPVEPQTPTTTAPPITTEETLPFTGADTSAMVGLGVSLAAAGVLVLLGTRNRKAEG